MLLYIFWFLHQTTTSAFACTSFTTLYIFWFLHQTTTTTKNSLISCGCISFDSYIKPQRCVCLPEQLLVVYLLIPTSNHNFDVCSRLLDYVVYLLIPTSNHNSLLTLATKLLLYIFWFLHQTTTSTSLSLSSISCISFDSYIKPQQEEERVVFHSVVYLLIPTSNHNVSGWLIR